MNKNNARRVVLEQLEQFSGKPKEEIDTEVETLASLGVDLEGFLNSVVAATRRGFIVHDYDRDTIQTIMDRTM